MMRKTLMAAVLTAVFRPTAVLPQEHPEIWGAPGPGMAYGQWTASTFVFNSDGELSDGLDDRHRESLLYSMENFRRLHGSAKEHGLNEGDLPPRELCPPKDRFVSFAKDEGYGQFGSTLLLSDVAVTASIKEVVHGFRGNWPEALVALEDVTPLRHGSPIPAYSIVALARLVINDHVFCGSTGTANPNYVPQPGDKIVLVGVWREHAAVEIGPRSTGYLAVVADEGHLEWKLGSGPEHLGEIREQIAAAEAKGLFEYTEPLRQQKLWSKDRYEFGETWLSHVDQGCPIVSAERVGERWTLTDACGKVIE